MSATPWLDTNLAANGEPVQMNFAKWFKNSKIVDLDGQPLVLYHGTAKDVDAFSRRHARSWAANNCLGHFFTRHPGSASAYSCEEPGSNVMPVFLALQNPYVQNVYQWQAMQGGSWSTQQVIDWKAEIMARGHDGIVDSVHVEYIAFKAAQVKSAIGNAGLYLGQSSCLTDQQSALDLLAGKKAKASLPPPITSRRRVSV